MIQPEMISPLITNVAQSLKKRKSSFSIIDVGCGSGIILYCLRQAGYLEKAETFGLDIDSKSIRIFKIRNPQAKTILSDALDLKKKIRSESFDFVICNQVVEHVKDDRILLSEINRILKKEGLLFISSVLKKWYGLYWYRNKFGQITVDPTHLREYASVKEFKQLLAGAGFFVKKLKILPGRLPLGDYTLRLLAKVGMIQFVDLNDYYLNHPFVYAIAKRLSFVPLPGYFLIEMVAEKKRARKR